MDTSFTSWIVGGWPRVYMGKENKYLNFTAYALSSVGSNARDSSGDPTS